ncbi:MAG: hypothetical protein IJ514_04215 [Clostridia bacterium]|nr:hypothetical protein [Clostridia bacterium]
MSLWKYYNHAVLPTTAPHERVDTSPIRDGTIWNGGGWKDAILARWTEDYDCGTETEFWYVIKDTPFDIGTLKSKRRYEITKGIKNFRVERICPREYTEEIFKVAVAAFEAYPAKYRPHLDKQRFIEDVKAWEEQGFIIYGAFYKETDELCGYAHIVEHEEWGEFPVLKTVPAMEKFGVNAAIVHTILTDANEKLGSGYYLCDGARAISHESAFQDYLEKYFGFRKAYCKLRIVYKPKYKIVIKLLYPFRKLLNKLDGVRLIHLVNGVLRMEYIIRKQEKNERKANR